MSKIAKTLTELIGNTPLLALNRFSKEAGLPNAIVAKLEYFNPLGSVKSMMSGLFSTHPSTEERIARLKALAAKQR